jgi:8-oxo-dGTP pyrophosphatase MutT (NUDIX family)
LFDSKEYVLVAALAPDGKMPFVLKKKPKILKGLLNLPGGAVEPGEHPEHAATRELVEETGLIGTPPIKLGMVVGFQSTIHVLVTSVNNEELVPRPSETEEMSWRTPEDLVEMSNLAPNLRLILPLVLAGVSGWTVECYQSWDGDRYDVKLCFSGARAFPVAVRLPGLGSF